MFKIPDTYDLIEAYNLKDISSKGYLLCHKKSGAHISLIENDDDNKVFYIGFRTPPTDSTGVAHIVEHTVLCGSDKYPIKEPFVELAKGSINTFLNAMTYPDKTVYPIASTNDKDFANLMDVYMDAVLYPNIYKERKIFEQEGWHFEMEDMESPITLNGVVYNEMKGAFSSPDDMLERETFSSLFPDTAYGFESGGDPKVIPELKYEDFLAFHKRYYHPSNSYIYLYGNCDMHERLEYLDKEYLSKFDKIDPDSEIKHQKPFKEPVEIIKKYPIASGEDTKDKTYLSLNFVTGSVLDPILYQALDILDYALLNAPGAPLRKALLDSGICKDVMGGFNSGILQPLFTIAVKGSNTSDLGEFLDIIKMTLENVIQNGIDQKSLLAGINSLQFVFREADFGGYPKGLLYGLINLDSWLYNKNHPFMHLHTIEILDELKNRIDTGYFEELANMFFIENEHASIVIIEPEEGLTAKQDEAVKNRLAEYKSKLSHEEIEKIVNDTRALKEYQEEPTSPEDLATIPLLKRSDLRKEAAPIVNRIEDIGGIKTLIHDIDTNGIHYLNLLYDIRDIERDKLPAMSFMTHMMGLVDTMEHVYSDYANEVNLITGGIYANVVAYTDEAGVNKPYISIRSKFLKEHTKKAIALVTEMIIFTKWEDKKRIKELLLQEISSFQMKMMSAGHSVALLRACSQFSPSAAFSEMTDGIEYYKFLKDFETNFDERIDGFLKLCKELSKKIFRHEGLLVSSTGKSEITDELKWMIPEIKELMSGEALKDPIPPFILEKANEGFKTSASIQYVARAGNFIGEGDEFLGSLHVLRTILSYEYLWNNVRVKGGAYGCMNNFKRNGDMYFVSYRDPNLRDTDKVFEETADYIENFEVDERDMTKYVIGTMSTLDTPLTPAQEGERSLGIYIRDVTYDMLQKSRDEVLGADRDSIRALSKYVRRGMETVYRCVLGNEEAIEEAKELFDRTEVLS